MEKKKRQWEGDEPKGVTVPRLAHKRHEKAQELRDARAAKTASSKRSLRIVKRVKNAPVLAICEYCNMQFSADPLGPAEAQAIIQQQFNAHTCKREDASQIPGTKKPDYFEDPPQMPRKHMLDEEKAKT